MHSSSLYWTRLSKISVFAIARAHAVVVQEWKATADVTDVKSFSYVPAFSMTCNVKCIQGVFCTFRVVVRVQHMSGKTGVCFVVLSDYYIFSEPGCKHSFICPRYYLEQY